MIRIIIIWFIGISTLSCAADDMGINSAIKNHQAIHQAHNENVLRQIKNDDIINKSIDSRNSVAPSVFKFDGEELSKENFIQMPIDSFFYLFKTFGFINLEKPEDVEYPKLLVSRYSGFSSHYYKNHSFTPSKFELSFDENDLLVLSVAHPVNGSLNVNGFDKATGKQIVRYNENNFKGDLSQGEALNNRNVDELRLVMTLADSIYIHDFKIEDFYTHEH